MSYIKTSFYVHHSISSFGFGFGKRFLSNMTQSQWQMHSCLCIVCRLLQVSVDRLEPSNSWIWVGWATTTQPRMWQTFGCSFGCVPVVHLTQIPKFEGSSLATGFGRSLHTMQKHPYSCYCHHVIYNRHLFPFNIPFLFQFQLQKNMPVIYDQFATAWVLMSTVQGSSRALRALDHCTLV